MKKVDTLILGENYTLSCDDDEVEILQRISKTLNLHMCDLREKGRHYSREVVAVLSALQLLVEQEKMHQAQLKSWQTKSEPTAKLELVPEADVVLASSPVPPVMGATPQEQEKLALLCQRMHQMLAQTNTP